MHIASLRQLRTVSMNMFTAAVFTVGKDGVTQVPASRGGFPEYHAGPTSVVGNALGTWRKAPDTMKSEEPQRRVCTWSSAVARGPRVAPVCGRRLIVYAE